MLPIKVYCDASMDSPSGLTVVGGLIGEAKEWDRVRDVWRNLLAAESMLRFRLSELRRRLTAGGYDEQIQRFAGVLKDSSLTALYAALNDHNWSQLDEHAGDKLICPTRQHACLNLMFHIISEHADLEFKGRQVHVILDNDYGSAHSANLVYEAWVERNRKSPFHKIEFLDQQPKPTELECADLIAGLIRRGPLGAQARSFALQSKITIEDWLRHPIGSARGTLWSLEIARQIDEIRKKVAEREGAEQDADIG